MQKLPSSLQYQQLKPVGWYTKAKWWQVQPMSSNQYWWPNQIIKFRFDYNKGVFDPYRSHLDFTVSTPTAANMPIGGIQVDTSAHSFISVLVLSSNNQQIERIVQYDTLSAYLVDIGSSQQQLKNRQSQGFGYSQYQVGMIRNTNSTSTSFSTQAYNGTTQVNIIQRGGQNGYSYSPSKSPVSPVQVGAHLASNAPGWGGCYGDTNKTSSHISNTNFLNLPANLIGSDLPNHNAILNNTGRFMNLRCQYVPQNILRHDIDSTTSFRTGGPTIANNVISTNWASGAGLNTGAIYTTNTRQTKYSIIGQNGIFNSQALPNIPSLYGYQKPVSSKFTVGCNQPLLSPTIPQCQFGYGLVLSKPIPVYQKRFQLVLNSSVMGSGIHCDQFKLLPLKAFYSALLQLTANPYAVFSTGYSDCHEFDKIGMTNQVKRQYYLSRMVYNLHIYQWPQQYIVNYIQQSLTKQIIVTSGSWALSGNYQIQTGQRVASNNYQIQTGPQSLCQVVLLFLSNQYLKYNFCRKQFRLSNNVRSAQLKFNIQYFPPQPLVGNAGNPENIDGSGDNRDFFQQILFAHNYKFSVNSSHPRINPYNFAVNGRPYDPSRIQTLYDPGMLNNPNYAWTASSVNTDTAMGHPWFHQNRCVGRAAYVFTFQPHASDGRSVVGLNTAGTRPMQVNFDVYTTNAFPTDQTLYAFTRANVVVYYGQNGIKVQGR